MSSHRAGLRIPSSHPALPGHFPGQPVVPGVVLLDAVLDAAQRWRGRPLVLAAVPALKFLKPLLPDQDADIVLEGEADRVRFRVLHGTTLLAQGTLELAP